MPVYILQSEWLWTAKEPEEGTQSNVFKASPYKSNDSFDSFFEMAWKCHESSTLRIKGSNCVRSDLCEEWSSMCVPYLLAVEESAKVPSTLLFTLSPLQTAFCKVQAPSEEKGGEMRGDKHTVPPLSSVKMLCQVEGCINFSIEFSCDPSEI